MRSLRHLERLRTFLREASGRFRETLPIASRLTLGAVVTYMTVTMLLGQSDLTGTLACLLVIQSSVYHTMEFAAERVFAMLLGVGFAVLLTTHFGTNIFTVALVVGLGYLISGLFSIKENSLEITISALFILSASSAGVAAEARIAGTLLGTVVGLAVVLLWPMRPQVEEALDAVTSVATSASREARAMAEHAREESLQPTQTIRRLQAMQPEVEHAREVVRDVRRSQLLNYAARDSFKQVPQDLMATLDALEDSIPQLQKLLVALDVQRSSSQETEERRAYAQAMREVLLVALDAVAKGLEAFGRVFDPQQKGDTQAHQKQLSDAHERLQEAEATLLQLYEDPQADKLTQATAESTVRALRSLRSSLDLEAIGNYRVSTFVEARKRARAVSDTLVAGLKKPRGARSSRER